MRKTLFLFTILLSLCSTAFAQYTAKVQLKDGTTHRLDIDKTERVRWTRWGGEEHTMMEFDGTSDTGWTSFYLNTIDKVTWESMDNTPPAEETVTFKLDEDNNTVYSPNYSISFGPCVLDGEKTLNVSRVANPKEPKELEGMVSSFTAFDFDIEGLHELNGVVEIRFPATENGCAAYYNESTGDWEPVVNYYDWDTSEIVILSNHLSTYGVFEVTDEHTRRAKMMFSTCKVTSAVDIEKVVDRLVKVAESDNPTFAAIDKFANEEFTNYSLGLSVGMNAIQGCGFEPKLLETYSDIIGKMGTAWSVVQLCNTMRKNDEADKALSATKFAIEQIIKPGVQDKIYAGNFLFSVCMTAVSVLDWEINAFRSEVHETATKLYSNAYKLYFGKNSIYPRKDGYGYRTATEWYRLLKPLFEDKYNEQYEIEEKIEKYVTEYVNQPWNDTDGFIEAVDDARGMWPFWVEITQKDRDNISDVHRKELYTGVLKSVLQNINREFLCKTMEEYNKIYKEYATFLNRVVTLDIKDSFLEGDTISQYAGFKVTFADMPSSITDPQDWACTLNNKGEGKIQFRLFPYCAEGFKPELVVIDQDDNKVKYITYSDIKNYGTYYLASIDLSGGSQDVPEAETKLEMDMNPHRWRTELEIYGDYSDYVDMDADMGEYFFLHLYAPYYYWKEDLWKIFDGDMSVSKDKEGNFSITKNGIIFEGTINPKTNRGTGTFHIKTLFEWKNKTPEEIKKGILDHLNYIYSDGGNTGAYELVNNWSYANLDMDIKGTFNVWYLQETEQYIFEVKGEGTYDLDAEACSNQYMFSKHEYIYDSETGTATNGSVTRDLNTKKFIDVVIDMRHIQQTNGQLTDFKGTIAIKP